MADVNEKVMAFVEKALEKDPGRKSSELFEEAKEMDPSIAELSSRQFHAQYPLQVHRRNAPKKPRTSRKRASRKKGGAQRGASANGQGARRDAVRDVLHRFARDLTASSEPQNVVEVMIDLDSYIDAIVKAN